MIWRAAADGEQGGVRGRESVNEMTKIVVIWKNEKNINAVNYERFLSVFDKNHNSFDTVTPLLTVLSRLL